MSKLRRRLGVAALATAALTLAGTLAAVPSAAQQFTGNTLYAPNVATNSRDSSSYPAMVRLSNSGSANGQILATHDFNSTDVLDHPGGTGQPNSGLPVYRSTDGGSSWSVISHIVDTRHGYQSFFPSLYEFPQQMGSYAAGTLVAGVTSIGPVGSASPTVDNLDVYVSTDHGVSWSYLSSCDTDSSYTVTHGIWENVFSMSSSGALVCYYSDERDSGSTYPQYSQLLVHRVSTDGGATWGSRVIDVAPQTNERPGMATVVKVPGGNYFMTFEVCGDDALHCATYMKTSTNGTSWGTTTNWGTRIATADGRWLEGNPYLAWSPAGGPQGTLIAHGRTIRYQQSGTALPAETPESQTTLFINTNGGSGPWSEIPAPFSYSPVTGGTCPGYRASFLPSTSGEQLLYMAPVLVSQDSAGPHCAIRYGNTTTGTLPYYAPFDGGNDTGFTTYGGTWSVSGGAYHNTSGGLGDKAVTGSTGWTDYTVQTDVRFDSLWSGASAGLMLRATSPSSGVDAYTGYYVGLDATGGITLAREDNGTYTGLDYSISIGTVSQGTWYHLAVQAIGCTFTITAQPAGSTSSQTVTYTDSGCAYTSGQIGIRTYGSQTSWRNLAATPGGTTAYSPVYAPWESGSTSGWTTFGGTWSTGSSAYSDTAGGSGDKALTGTSGWGSNTLTADVKVSSSGGNSGLVARVTSPSTGADAYYGYYAGLSPSAGTLQLGRSNNGSYTTLQSVAVPGGVAVNGWYHLTFQNVGCALTVTAQSTSSHDKVTTAYTDPSCYTNGQVGIRTYNSQASWRYFSMLPR